MNTKRHLYQVQHNHHCPSWIFDDLKSVDYLIRPQQRGFDNKLNIHGYPGGAGTIASCIYATKTTTKTSQTKSTTTSTITTATATATTTSMTTT